MAKKSSSRGKGKGKDKDPITGRSMLLSDGSRTFEVKDDVVYEVIEGSPDTTADDVLTPLATQPTGAPRPGSHYMQYQFGNDRVVQTSYGSWAPDAMYRSVSLGSFSYDKKGRLSLLTETSWGMIQKSDSNTDVLFGTVERFLSPQQITPDQKFSGVRGPTEITANYCYNCADGVEKGGGLAAIRAFGGGKYFFEGWQINLFDTSLV